VKVGELAGRKKPFSYLASFFSVLQGFLEVRARIGRENSANKYSAY
jgi:hypothetical protein